MWESTRTAAADGRGQRLGNDGRCHDPDRRHEADDLTFGAPDRA
jgi:hypothetical protein